MNCGSIGTMFTRACFWLFLLWGCAFARNQATLVADLRFHLGQMDSLNSNWTNTELRNCLDMAQYTVAAHSGGVQKLDTLAGGSLRYHSANGLNSDFIALKQNAWLWRLGKENMPIPYVPVDSFNALIARNDEQVKGSNKIITEDGGGLAVFPKVNQQDSILISYYAFPDALDTSDCDFNASWEEVLLLAAASIAYEHLKDDVKVQFYIVERDKNIAALRDMTSRRPQLAPVR